MPRRREGPTLNKQTQYYFFDSFVGFPPDRKRIRVSLRTKDLAKAQFLWEQEYRRRWATYYGLESQERPQAVKFLDAGREFIEYQRDIRHIKEWKTARDRFNIILNIWKNIDLHKIIRSHFIELDRRLREMGRSENTINHYFSLLKTFFNFAIKKKKYVGENPVKEIKPYVVNEKRRAYSREEISRILAAAREIASKSREGALLENFLPAMILFLLLTGMRLGELLALRWDNVQADKIVIGRTETKQKKEKVIPITSAIRALLDDLQAKKKDGFVLPLARRGKTKLAYCDGVIRKIREISGVKDFIFHGLRHTASTIMISEAMGRGVSLADVMKILGHSRMETTMRYIHPDFERMKKAAEILEEKIKT